MIELIKQVDLSFQHRGVAQNPRVTRQCHPDRLPRAKAQAVMISFLTHNGIVATKLKIQWTSPMTLLKLMTISKNFASTSDDESALGEFCMCGQLQPFQDGGQALCDICH